MEPTFHLFAVYQSLELGASALKLYKCQHTSASSGYIHELHKWIAEVDETADRADHDVIIDDTFLYLADQWDAKRPPAELPRCLWEIDPAHNPDWSSHFVDARSLRLGGKDIETITIIQGSKESEREDDGDDDDRMMSKEDWEAVKAARAAKRPAEEASPDEPEAKRRRLE